MTERDVRGDLQGLARPLYLLVRRRLAALGALAALIVATGFLAPEARRILPQAKVSETMIPEDHPFLPVIRDLEGAFPEQPLLAVVLSVNSGDVYRPETIRKVEEITRGLMAVQGVVPGGLLSLTKGINHYENSAEGLQMEPILGRKWPETPREMEALRRRVAVNPLGLGAYVAYDGTATLITAPLAPRQASASRSPGRWDLLPEDPGRVELLAALEALKAKVNDERHTLWFMSPDLLPEETSRTAADQIPPAAAATGAILLVLLLVRFRSWQGVLVPFLAMVLCLVWTAGLLGSTGLRIHPLLVPFAPLLSLFSLALAAAAFDGYARLSPFPREKAVAVAFGERFLWIALVAVGACAATLFAARVPFLAQAARIGLAWAGSTFAIVLIFCPCLVSLLPPPKERARTPHPVPTFLPHLSRAARTTLAGLLVLGGIGTALSSVGGNTPGASWLSARHRWNRCFRLMEEKFAGPHDLRILVKADRTGGLLAPGAIHAVAAFREYMEEEGGARRATALDTLIRSFRAVLMDGNPKWQTLPLSPQRLEELVRLMAMAGGTDPYLDKTFTQAVVTCVLPLCKGAGIDTYLRRIEAYLKHHPEEGLTFRMAGGLVGITKAIDDGTRRAARTALPAALLVLFLLGIALTGSLGAGLLLALTLVLVPGMLAFLMATTGTPLSMPAVAPLVVSLGFSVLFPGLLLRGLHAGMDRDRAAGRGSALFTGTLVWAAALPWTLVDLRSVSLPALVLVLLAAMESVALSLLLPRLLPQPPLPRS